MKVFTFGAAFGIASASSLLFVRAGIIWRWGRWVVIFLTPFVLALYACAIRTVVLFKSTFDPDLRLCTLDSVIQDRGLFIAMFACDLTLLAFIFVGLRKGWPEARIFPLWFVLWNQGLLYFALAVMVEAPLVVFLMLNLNEIMNTIFVVPTVFLTAAGATRFHRILTQYSGRALSAYKVPIPPIDPKTFELRNLSPSP